MSEDISITAGYDHKIAANYAKPTETSSANRERLLVIMVHGFPGHKEAHEELYPQLQLQLTAKGFHSLSFDFRGCGASDGEHEDFSFTRAKEDFGYITDWAEKLGYERFMIIAEGLGAALALKYLGKKATCFVLLWPMLDLPAIASSIFEAGEIEEEWRKAGFKIIHDHRIGVKLLDEMKANNMKEIIKTLGKPILTMHGAQDTISPIEQLDMLRASAGVRRIEITSFHDGTHGLPQLNHRKTMFFHIFQFLEKYA